MPLHDEIDEIERRIPSSFFSHDEIEEIVRRILETEEGRVALAQSIIEPIRLRQQQIQRRQQIQQQVVTPTSTQSTTTNVLEGEPEDWK